MLPAGCAKVSSGRTVPVRPGHYPNQRLTTPLAESGFLRLVLERFEGLVDLGASTPPPWRSPACRRHRRRGLAAPRTRSPALMPALRAASLVATATIGLSSSFTPARATTTGRLHRAGRARRVRSCAGHRPRQSGPRSLTATLTGAGGVLGVSNQRRNRGGPAGTRYMEAKRRSDSLSLASRRSHARRARPDER